MRPEIGSLIFGYRPETPRHAGGNHQRRPLFVEGLMACLMALSICARMAGAQTAAQSVLTNPVPQGSPIPRILPQAPPGTSATGIEAPPIGPVAPLAGPPV